MRSWLRELTGGTGTVVSEFLELRPAGPPPPRSRNGVLVVNTPGTATSVDLGKAARLGEIFIPARVEVYTGMIFGECSSSASTGEGGDIDTNISRKHDGYETAKPTPHHEKT